jgi:hypothetical protein
MSDPRYDPNFPRHDTSDDFDPRIQWGAVAVLLLLIGGIIVASMYSGGDTQVASNPPAAQSETTGSATPMQRPPQRP